MKEKEYMSITELEDIALDGSVRVPEKLRDDIRAELDTLAFLTETPAVMPRRFVRIASVAASIALVAALGFGVTAETGAVLTKTAEIMDKIN